MDRKRFNELFTLSGPAQNPDEMFWLTQYIEQLGPHVIVEIGVQEGGSLRFWEQVLQPGDLLIGIDKDPRVLEWVQTRRRWNWQESSRRVFLIIGDSTRPETIRRVKETLEEREIDLLFLDGNHDYKYVKTDFFNYASLVRTGGMVVFHDIGYFGPKKFFDSLNGRKDSVRFHKDLGMGYGAWWKA